MFRTRVQSKCNPKNTWGIHNECKIKLNEKWQNPNNKISQHKFKIGLSRYSKPEIHWRKVSKHIHTYHDLYFLRTAKMKEGWRLECKFVHDIHLHTLENIFLTSLQCWPHTFFCSCDMSLQWYGSNFKAANSG